jgi:hypothetical protein
MQQNGKKLKKANELDTNKGDQTKRAIIDVTSQQFA